MKLFEHFNESRKGVILNDRLNGNLPAYLWSLFLFKSLPNCLWCEGDNESPWTLERFACSRTGTNVTKLPEGLPPDTCLNSLLNPEQTYYSNIIFHGEGLMISEMLAALGMHLHCWIKLMTFHCVGWELIPMSLQTQGNLNINFIPQERPQFACLSSHWKKTKKTKKTHKTFCFNWIIWNPFLDWSTQILR